MSFDNNSFYDDNSTKNWQPQPTPMEDRRRRHTGRWITAIVILALLVLTGVGTVHLVRDVGVTINRSDSGFLLTIGREQPAESADVQTADPQPAAQEQAAAAEGPAPAAQTPVQAQAQAELPQLEISSSPAGVPTSASEDAGALSLQEIYRRCSGSVVSIISVTQSGKASGTGIIMSADGYIITNHHVIENAQAVSVLTNDDKEYTASIIGSDETSDLAVLKIEASGLQAAEFGDSSVLQVGDSVVAIGDPLGVTLRGTMTDGIISAINRDLTVNDRTMNLIQTNAALNNGNSGGPLFDMNGNVIGITAAKYSGQTASGTTIEGIGFAIPIDDALRERFGHRRFAHARLADEAGVVLLAAAENLHHALQLFFTADDGVQLLFARLAGQVHTELGKVFALGLAVALRAPLGLGLPFDRQAAAHDGVEVERGRAALVV